MKTIRAKFIFGSITILLAILALSGAGIWSSTKLAGDLYETEIISTGLRNHTEADMMHDGIRGDVLAAILFSQSGQHEAYNEVRTNLEEHVKNFEKLVQENEELKLPAEIKAALTKIEAPLRVYLDSAHEYVARAGVDPARTIADLNGFEEKFSALESPMGAITTEFEAHTNALRQESDKVTEFSKKFMLGATLLALFIGGTAALFGVTGIARPLSRLVAVVQELASGKLHVEVPYTTKKDEVGTLAQAMEVFRNSMREAEKLREEQELTKRQAEIENRKAMNKMADDFESAVNGVVNAVAHAAVEMKNYAETLASMADQTNSRSATVAAASEQAAANVSTVAAATEELSSSIHEITRQVSDSSRTAGAAVDEARATNKTISGLADAAQKIGDVVQLISEIANQTNLLALNATIEAARAGEAGKGFAVVASEVKNLANQTAKATEDITAQITGMQTIAGDAVRAIQGIGGTIEKINGISSAIAAAVEEQGAATQEISRNVQEAAIGTKDVSSNIVSVTQSAGETGQVATQVLSAAEQLAGESNRLKGEVEKFITRVRAA